MPSATCLFVVLAAGEGTRMRSALPKAMHRLAGDPMLGHVLRAATSTVTDARSVVVVGPGMDPVAEFARQRGAVGTWIQADRLGTAHAVLAARETLAGHAGDVVVLYADTPLIRPETISRLRDALAGGANVAVLGFYTEAPTGYGRLILRDGRLTAIREESDATEQERAITLCNSGVMAFRAGLLPDLLDEIGNDNARAEYYLTDAVEVANRRGLRAVAVDAEESEVLGVNSRAQLAEAEAVVQSRLRRAALEGGATLDRARHRILQSRYEDRLRCIYRT